MILSIMILEMQYTVEKSQYEIGIYIVLKVRFSDSIVFSVDIIPSFTKFHLQDFESTDLNFNSELLMTIRFIHLYFV